MEEKEDALKRFRSTNFSEQEKSSLINIIAKYKDVIENKKTDGVTNHEKNQTWDRITQEFNASTFSNVRRSKEVLKRFYENKKKEIRKKAADQKLQHKRTGGGPPNTVNKESYEDLLLSITNEKTVYGLNTQYGGDIDSSEGECDTENTTKEISFELNSGENEEVLTKVF